MRRNVARHLLALAGALFALVPLLVASHAPGVLRVCSDPNNLPFSDSAGRGFENRIAELLARDLGDRVEYTWWAQRRGFARHTLLAGQCDVIMGTPAGADPLRTTRPYYSSSYVFVYPRSRGWHIRSFSDTALRHLRIGVHLIGDDFNSLPPAVALARRGLAGHVVGYSIYGNYAESSPPARLIDAVAQGDVDIAAAWGPLAGYFAQREPVPLEVVPVATDPADGPAARFVYSIAIAVRPADSVLQSRLQTALDRHHAAIEQILRSYGVPLVSAR